MATGEGVSGDGAGEGGRSGSGASPRFLAPNTRGAMIVFSTLTELQTGQATSPALTCLSQVGELWTQPSNACPWPHASAYRTMPALALRAKGRAPPSVR